MQEYLPFATKNNHIPIFEYRENKLFVRKGVTKVTEVQQEEVSSLSKLL
jgi:hypothetical protein